MEIKTFDLNSVSAWDELVNRFSGGPYLYRAWQEACLKTYGQKPVFLLAFRGQEAAGGLVLSRFKGLRSKSLVSLPFCDYGGPLAEDEEVKKSLVAKAERLSQEIGPLEIRFPEPVSFLPEGSTAKVRLLLPLPDDTETLWKSFKAKVRSQIRRPMKEGAQAICGGLELVPAFYRIYAQNMHFLGSPPHALSWFRNIVSAYKERARVVLVHLEGKPLAGAILLLTPQVATVPWASSLRAYKRISPNMLLYWRLLSLAVEEGAKLFDFGRSTPGSGTYRFKKQWGAQEAPLFWYRVPASEEKTSRLRPYVEKLWRRLPERVANYLGPKLRGRIAL